jgi:hypothetical protein
MFENLKPAVRWLIAWALCLAGLAIFHFAFVTPRARALLDCRRETGAQAQQYGDFVFNSDELNGLDFRIRSLAEKNGLWDFSGRYVATTSTIGTTRFKRIAQRELVLSFNCGFPDFLRFVNELERHQPFMFVNQFTIRNAAGKEVGLSSDMECSILHQTTGR